MMTKDDIISRISSRSDALRDEGIEHIGVFGSRARRDAKSDSDLDILIDVTPGARFSLLNLSGVALLIEECTGLPTQVVLRRSSPTAFLQRISDDLVQVY
jgi:uncharacterized protein